MPPETAAFYLTMLMLLSALSVHLTTRLFLTIEGVKALRLKIESYRNLASVFFSCQFCMSFWLTGFLTAACFLLLGIWSWWLFPVAWFASFGLTQVIYKLVGDEY